MKAPPDWLLILLCVITLTGIITLVFLIAAMLMKGLVAFLLLIFYVLLSAG